MSHVGRFFFPLVLVEVEDILEVDEVDEVDRRFKDGFDKDVVDEEEED